MDLYQKLLKLAADSGPRNLYSVDHKTISGKDGLEFNKFDFAILEPPSFWADSDKFVENM